MVDHTSSSSTSKSGAAKECKPAKKYVRVMTDRRREQNRRSQKAHRERLKKRLEGLEPSSANAPPHKEQQLEVEQDQIADFIFDDVAATYPATIDLGDAFQASGDLSLPGGSSLPLVDIAILTQCNSPEGTRPVPPYTIPAPLPYPILQDIDLFPLDSDPGFSIAWPAHSASRKHSSPTNQSSHSTTPSDQLLPFSPVASSWPGFSPQANHLRLQGLNCFAAQMAVAASLGITQESYLSDYMSPFFLTARAYVSGVISPGSVYWEKDPSLTITCSSPASSPAEPMSPDSPIALELYSSIKPDMRPTAIQLRTPHPSYLDCIVFPSFRERAILLSHRGELDHMALFTDLVNDGLLCWGAARSGGMEHGVAWSMRSWEAKPWFLKKWAFLAGGEEEEIWRGSRWWWTLRGEDVED